MKVSDVSLKELAFVSAVIILICMVALALMPDKENEVEVEFDDSALLEEVEEFEYLCVTAEIPEFTYTLEEVKLLAAVAQCEAGPAYAHKTAFRYVVQVVLNRVASADFPGTIAEVVYQKEYGIPQFSVAYDGTLDNCVLTSDSMLATYEVIVFGCALPYFVEYFYATGVTDNWVNTLNIYTMVDGTTFAYSERSVQDYE